MLLKSAGVFARRFRTENVKFALARESRCYGRVNRIER